MSILWKQIFPTLGHYRETVVDQGSSVSGTLAIDVSTGNNHKMTLVGNTTINITTAGQPSGTIGHVLLYITMASDYAVTWQLNGVTQSGVELTLDSAGATEVCLRSWDNWATYIGSVTN